MTKHSGEEFLYTNKIMELQSHQVTEIIDEE